jgi:hypothetical protein
MRPVRLTDPMSCSLQATHKTSDFTDEPYLYTHGSKRNKFPSDLHRFKPHYNQLGHSQTLHTAQSLTDSTKCLSKHSLTSHQNKRLVGVEILTFMHFAVGHRHHYAGFYTTENCVSPLYCRYVTEISD